MQSISSPNFVRNEETTSLLLYRESRYFWIRSVSESSERWLSATTAAVGACPAAGSWSRDGVVLPGCSTGNSSTASTWGWEPNLDAPKIQVHRVRKPAHTRAAGTRSRRTRDLLGRERLDECMDASPELVCAREHVTPLVTHRLCARAW